MVYGLYAYPMFENVPLISVTISRPPLLSLHSWEDLNITKIILFSDEMAEIVRFFKNKR